MCGRGLRLYQDKKDEDEAFIDGVFGELLDPETKSKIRYIRSQRKARFTKGLPPDHLWDLWDKRNPGEMFCNDWLYGAVFKGDRSDTAQKMFEDYLLEICPDAKPNWVKFHLALEFNNPRLRDGSKAEFSYTVPPNSLIRNWWQVLQIEPLSNYQAIKGAYQNLAADCQSDEEMLHQLNKAYDQALFFYEVRVKKETRVLLKQDILYYPQIIQQINQQMERIKWTKEQGKEYLIQKYNKHSRQLLSDEELLEFLIYLSEL